MSDAAVITVNSASLAADGSASCRRPRADPTLALAHPIAHLALPPHPLPRDVYALKGRVLGDLFCALSHAKVTFPRAARVARALNSRVDGRPLRVLAASESCPRARPRRNRRLPGAQLVLGPLHLDRLASSSISAAGPTPTR